jgi:hypothetical protein
MTRSPSEGRFAQRAGAKGGPAPAPEQRHNTRTFLTGGEYASAQGRIMP